MKKTVEKNPIIIFVIIGIIIFIVWKYFHVEKTNFQVMKKTENTKIKIECIIPDNLKEDVRCGNDKIEFIKFSKIFTRDEFFNKIGCENNQCKKLTTSKLLLKEEEEEEEEEEIKSSVSIFVREIPTEKELTRKIIPKISTSEVWNNGENINIYIVNSDFINQDYSNFSAEFVKAKKEILADIINYERSDIRRITFYEKEIVNKEKKEIANNCKANACDETFYFYNQKDLVQKFKKFVDEEFANYVSEEINLINLLKALPKNITGKIAIYLNEVYFPEFRFYDYSEKLRLDVQSYDFFYKKQKNHNYGLNKQRNECSKIEEEDLQKNCLSKIRPQWVSSYYEEYMEKLIQLLENIKNANNFQDDKNFDLIFINKNISNNSSFEKEKSLILNDIKNYISN